MYLQQDEARKRPLVEFAELRWQRLRQGNAAPTRLLWRRQDPQEAAAERTAGIEVLQEDRLLPGLGREFIPSLDEGSLLYMPSLLPMPHCRKPWRSTAAKISPLRPYLKWPRWSANWDGPRRRDSGADRHVRDHHHLGSRRRSGAWYPCSAGSRPGRVAQSPLLDLARDPSHDEERDSA